MRSDLAAARSLYNRDAVLSASPARILTMLYDRLLLDLQRAEAAQRMQNWPAASPNLLHAQDIVAELVNSLRPDVWDGGPGLLALYGYVTTAMMAANIRRDVEKTRECIRLLEPLRAAWHEAAQQLAVASVSASAPTARAWAVG
jgi:flagellar protein FliS